MLDSFLLTPEIPGKHSKKFLKNAKNENLLKFKRINTEIQDKRGAHFLHLACQGGDAHPSPPPVSYATDCRFNSLVRFD